MRQMMIPIALFASLISSQFADATEEAPDHLALRLLDDLTRDCGNLTHAEWARRYREQSVEVMERARDFPSAEFRALSDQNPFKSLVVNLFPQHTPKGKRRPAPNLCFPILWKFLDERKPQQRKEAADLFDACHDDRNAGEIPSVVRQVTACWRRLKP